MLHAKACGVALALIVMPATAFAQSAAPSVAPQSQTQMPEARVKVREACAADVQKFCANIERAKGAMRGCLQAHEKDLSDSCRAARIEREAARSKDKG